MIIQDEDDDSFEEFDFEIIDEIVAKETQTTSDLKQLEESEKQLLIGEIYVIRKSLDETITENKELKLKAAQGMIDLNKNVSELKQIHDREIEKLKTQLQFKQNEYRKLEESISMNNSTARVSVPSSPIVPVTIVPKKRKDDDGFLTMKTFGSTSFKKISKTGAMDGIKIERIVENEIIDDNLDFPMELFDEIPDPIENNPEIVMQHEESINEIPSNTPLLFKEHVQETTSLNDNNDTVSFY